MALVKRQVRLVFSFGVALLFLVAIAACEDPDGADPGTDPGTGPGVESPTDPGTDGGF
ncbi:MAG: hypothetical protein WD533_05860 [Dehalococcoidia bacterium]